MTVQLKPSARQTTTAQTAVSFWTAARTSNELCGPLPAAVLKPDNPGTSTAGLAARLWLFPRPPLAAGTGAITAICGMLDAATFLGLGHVFAETMNGNIIFLAFTVATHGIPPLTSLLAATVLPYALVLVCFAAGAVAGGRLVRRDGETGRRIGFASDAALIGVAAVVVALTHPAPAGQARYLVIGILAVAMGMQNVLIRRWGIPDLATNAMTKTMAYLVADSALGGGDNHHAIRRGMSIVIFAAGAAIGASLSRYGVLWPILTSFTLFVLALPILLRRPASDPVGTQIRPNVSAASPLACQDSLPRRHPKENERSITIPDKVLIRAWPRPLGVARRRCALERCRCGLPQAKANPNDPGEQFTNRRTIICALNRPKATPRHRYGRASGMLGPGI